MKILKIELQNINSLKSDSSIIIDFENEQFKEVGLYAITGSTGAGKTTILDAITIALYHNVPRFRGTKGTLLDVVSFGATEAFSRVTFENENVTYEAYWGIRLTTNAGKKLVNPQEEVSLKNLTKNKILASQKRAVITDIVSVTQLDYDQFLRSVMLAQGEFASFLTAKGPEKGRLLEQITGEQIYKKIGQGILDRKTSEENKLKEIQSKINSDDILTEESKIELTQNDKELDNQIAKSDNQIESIQQIVNWYIKSMEITNQSEILEQDSIEINNEIENHKAQFNLLDLNEKAEPFKEIIQNFSRNEKNTLEKVNQLKFLDEQLALLKLEIARLTDLYDKQTNDLKVAEKTFTEWLPKFDQITKLDGQIKNENDNNEKTKSALNDLNIQIGILHDNKIKHSNRLTETEAKIKVDEAFVTQNKFLSDVGTEISNWTKDLTTLKEHKKTLIVSSSFITQKKEEIVTATTELTTNKENLNKEQLEIELIDKEINAIHGQLSENNLSDLLTKKEKLSTTESNWKQFKDFADEIAKKEGELANISTQKNVFKGNLDVLKKEVEAIKNNIISQEAYVADAEQILHLERSISKYEDDRKNLIEGQPCGLCGSIEHPFANSLKVIDVSKSESELKTRKDKLKELIDVKSKLDLDVVKLSTRIDAVTQQINSINEDIKTIHVKTKQLNVDCKLTDLIKINSELDSTSEQLKSLNLKIKVAHQLQAQKDTLLNTSKAQHKSIELLKTKDDTLNEKIKNTRAEIDSKEHSIDELTRVCTNLENDLTSKLSNYNYQLPYVEHINKFIESITLAIGTYNRTQMNLVALKSDAKVLNSNIISIEKQLAEHLKTQNGYTNIINECENKSVQLTKERNEILPLGFTVERKRKSLQSLNKQLDEKVDSVKKDLQKSLDTLTKKEVLKIENQKEQHKLTEELHSLNSLLEVQIKDSDFVSKLDIEKALLTKEDKVKYTQNKQRIKEKLIRLETLKETNLKDQEVLNKSKNFELSEIESKIVLDELKNKKEYLFAKKGEIKEAFRKDLEIRNRNQEVYEKIDAQAAICNVWKELYKIIGNSSVSFNVYVQRLTLKHLLDLANVHLYKLNRRYSLIMEEDYKAREELDFNLIDHYQADQSRLVDTSSGGEKFIISLALALGLSDLASKNVKIDSLFIDEGFGTLDKNTLETVIYTLETLQSQGKMIGIISHVENLKERIPTQIQITKKSNGVSVVEIINKLV